MHGLIVTSLRAYTLLLHHHQVLSTDSTNLCCRPASAAAGYGSQHCPHQQWAHHLNPKLTAHDDSAASCSQQTLTLSPGPHDDSTGDDSALHDDAACDDSALHDDAACDDSAASFSQQTLILSAPHCCSCSHSFRQLRYDARIQGTRS